LAADSFPVEDFAGDREDVPAALAHQKRELLLTIELPTQAKSGLEWATPWVKQKGVWHCVARARLNNC
jgi:hypothetical protein